MLRTILLASICALTTAFLAFTSTSQAQETTSTLDDVDRAELQQLIRSYILENPEVVIEAINIYERRRHMMEAAKELQLVGRYSDALANDGYSFVGGNPEGSITIVEFLDYRCGFCKRAHPEIKALIEADPDVRLVVKEFPILGPESVLASRAALAVLRQEDGRFYADFSDKLMTYGGPINDTVLTRLAERAGADATQMKEDMNHPDIEAQIAGTRELAQALGISGTPSFVFGNKIVRGFIPLNEMQEVLQLARNAQN